MKTKTLMAAAAMALLVALPARATEPTAVVVSQNTVGYQKLTIPAGGYALLANPFTIVGSDGEQFAINDMFTDDVGQVNGGVNSGVADTIQPFNSAAQGYTTTYYFSSRINKWSKGNPNQAATTPLDPGDGFWYFNRSTSKDITLTVSGEVATNDVTVTLVPGYTLVCNPFPADLPLNDGSIDWVAAGANGGNNSGVADKIQPFNSEAQGYTTTYYFSSRINKWSKGNPNQATTDAIPAGAGFWYFNNGSSDITITLKSPLSTQN